MKAEEIKQQINQLIEAFHEEVFKESSFVPGASVVPVSGKVFDKTELQYITEAALDGWFTTGRFNHEFEKKLAQFINIKSVITVNSGSSANLIAFAALTSSQLGERAIMPGDEVITVAVSFPTTVNPIVFYGAVPVFIDVEIPTYQIDTNLLEKALSDKTKAVMVAHALGNPFNLDVVTEFCKKHNLWLIEDCCDALGAKYKNKHVGTFGDIGTLSFYPAHHITTGEGGAVFTDNPKLKTIMESFRDWGRDCWCEPGKDNTCGKRFSQKCGDLPLGYDHKYTYSRMGFNLKITDMQAALGLAQLKKLERFIEIRNSNFDKITNVLKVHQDKLILPKQMENSQPSWFGYLITIKKESGINRVDFINELNKRKIATRLLFAGDIRKQPSFQNIKYREVGEFLNTDIILHQTFWIGVGPLINDEMITYIGETFEEILNTFENAKQ